MMAADRRLWDTIAELVNSKKWSLDDAIAEVADVRSDMTSLLQPRPLPPKNVPADVPRNFWRPSKGNKGKGKGGGKGGAKGAGKQLARFGDSRSSSDPMASSICCVCDTPLVRAAIIPRAGMSIFVQ